MGRKVVAETKTEPWVYTPPKPTLTVSTSVTLTAAHDYDTLPVSLEDIQRFAAAAFTHNCLQVTLEKGHLVARRSKACDPA